MKTRRPKQYQKTLSLSHITFEEAAEKVLAYNPKYVKKLGVPERIVIKSSKDWSNKYQDAQNVQ
jgi:hypothetical protein